MIIKNQLLSLLNFYSNFRDRVGLVSFKQSRNYAFSQNLSLKYSNNLGSYLIDTELI